MVNGAGTECWTADEHFGPFIPSACRGGFDFTLSFEQDILSIVPNVLFVLAAVLRLSLLVKRPRKSVDLIWRWTSVVSFYGLLLHT